MAFETSRMNRRAFLASTVAIATATPYAAAQAATKIFSVGWLTAQRAPSLAPFLDAFRSGLADLGYHEQENLKIEYRYGDDASRHWRSNWRKSPSTCWLYREQPYPSFTS